MVEAGGSDQMKVLEAEHVFREQRAIGGLTLIVVESDSRLIVLVDDRVRGLPLVVRTAGGIQRVPDRQGVAGAPAVQPATVEAGVVEALTAECGARAGGRNTGVSVRACP